MLQESSSRLPDYATRTIAPDRDASQGIDFTSAQSVRHKARLSAMNPNYWYPAEWSRNLQPGQRIETRFWGSSIALFRTADGKVAALENRCAHRNLPLTLGKVRGCNLVCAYHGWAFNPEGVLQSVEHDLFGHELPRIKIRTHPVAERYGLIWIFPGDPALAGQVPLPLIPNAEGEHAWASFSFDFTWNAHYSMVIDNLANLTHLYVHGKWSPFDKTWMVHSDLTGERLELIWRHTLRRSRMQPIHKVTIVLPGEENLCETDSLYDYPYHCALSSGRMRSVNLMLPMSESVTRVFTMQQWKRYQFSMLPRSWRKPFMDKVLMPLMRPGTMEVYRQDGQTVQAEMSRLDANFFKPTPEINHSVRLFDRVNAERWQAWLDYRNGNRESTVTTRQKILLAEPLAFDATRGNVTRIDREASAA